MGPWKRTLGLVAVASVCCLWGCAKRGAAADPSLKPKFEPKKEAAADQALERAIVAADIGPKDKAADSYLEVRKAFPESTAGQEALYRAGTVYFERKDFVSARKAFNELLLENPLFDKALDAKLKLGLAALELGAFRDAYQTLSSVAQRLEGEERARALKAAGKAAEGGHLFPEALGLALGQLDEAKSPDEQKEALQRVSDLVEGKVSFLDVAKTWHELSPKSPAWPLFTFKLARIYYHLRDWTRLSETLQLFLKEAPNDPLASEARELFARANRRSQVKPKVVGVLLPMTGSRSLLGEAVLRGIQLGFAGSDVEVVVKDTQGDINLAAKAVEELAFDDGAIAIIGPLLAEDSRRAALAAEELQVPILTLTRQEGVTRIGPHVFNNMLTSGAQAKALAEYGTAVLGYKNFAVLYPNVSFGVELANDFWDEVVKRGGSMRGAESYTHDQTTFTTEVKKLVGRYYLEDRADYLEKVRELNANEKDAFRKRKALEKIKSQLEPVVDFDALFIPDEWSRVGLLAPALAVEDIVTNACDPKDLEKIRKTTGKKDLKTVTLLGSVHWSSGKDPTTGLPKLVDRGGKFVTCSVYVDGFFADSARPATKKFVKAFREAYKGRGGDISMLEAVGYDSANIYRELIARGIASRAEFRDRLSQVTDFDGATGKTRFNDLREAERPLFFLSVQSDGVKEISAERPPGS